MLVSVPGVGTQSHSSHHGLSQGSPAIKFIDFGGACTFTADEGLVGLVGTPQVPICVA